MKDPKQQLRERIDDDVVPASISVRPSFDNGAVVEIAYDRLHHGDVHFPIEDGKDVTNEPDALHGDAVLVGLYEEEGLGTPDMIIDADVRFMEEVDHSGESEESAQYVHVSDYDNNHTHHPHHHLVRDDMDPVRYFLFE